MNLLQSPPAHDPTTDTIDTFRTRNFSLNDPPGYNYEGAPPLYYCHDGTGNEAGMPERPSRKKIKAKARKVAFIRIMASVVVVSTVALIVGGVASKIDGMKKAEQASNDTHNTSDASPEATQTQHPEIVVMSSQTTTLAPTATQSAPTAAARPTASTTDTVPGRGKQQQTAVDDPGGKPEGTDRQPVPAETDKTTGSSKQADSGSGGQKDSGSQKDTGGGKTPCRNLSCATTELPSDCTAKQYAAFMDKFCMADTELFSNNSD